jgi:hypothetical protein
MQQLVSGQRVVAFKDAYEDVLEVHLIMELCRGGARRPLRLHARRGMQGGMHGRTQGG